MRNTKRTLAVAGVSLAAMIAAPALYAHDAHETAGSMMGGRNMMARMDRMMGHCSTMMQGGSDDNRPNDQWRKRSPSTPDKDD